MIEVFFGFFFAVITGVAAATRGRSGFGWFVVGFCFTIIGLIVLLRMPNLKPQQSTDVSAQFAAFQAAGTRACPYCAETIKAAAIRCRHCGCDIPALILESPIPEPVGRGWTVRVACAGSQEALLAIQLIESERMPAFELGDAVVVAGPFPDKDHANAARKELLLTHRLRGDLYWHTPQTV